VSNRSTRPAPRVRAHPPRSTPPETPAPAPREVARARLDDALRPFVLGTAGMLTERRVAAAARDAAEAVLPLLGEPPRSAHRARGLIAAVLTCGWAEFDAAYAEALDALLALPPAVRDVEDPAWDAALPPERAARRHWVQDGKPWVPAEYGSETVAPGGTAGVVVRRGARSVLVTGDGREVRLHARCACDFDEHAARAAVPFEHVHLRRDGSILDVTVGTACGRCRAPRE
jgi:hypothetical protein